jgi:hypothetical protein
MGRCSPSPEQQEQQRARERQDETAAGLRAWRHASDLWLIPGWKGSNWRVSA